MKSSYLCGNAGLHNAEIKIQLTVEDAKSLHSQLTDWD